MLGMKVINVCSQISLGLKLSTSTMSFSTRVLPPLNKEQKMTLLLVLHPHRRQVLTRRFLLLFRAVSDTGLTWNKQNISSLLWVFSSGAGAGNQAGFTSSVHRWVERCKWMSLCSSNLVPAPAKHRKCQIVLNTFPPGRRSLL